MHSRLVCLTVVLLAAGLNSGPAVSVSAQTPQAPAAEAIVPDRVVQLFNGRDLTGWTPDVPAKDKDASVPASFIVRNGMLVSLGTPRGHLLTDAAYRDYRAEVEYRFPGKPGNCGVLVHASRLRALSSMFPQSIEVQMNHLQAGDFWCIHENIEVPDMEARRPRKEGQQYGGTDGDARRILNLTDNSEKPLGEWNTMVIEARGRTLKVWVNGDLVNDGFNSTADRGRLAIQAEGAEVEFRRVQIGPLTPPPAPPQQAGGGGGRGPQGPPLLPTPPLTAPPTPDKDGNFVIGPPYTPAPELTVKDGVPKGTVHEFTMDSKDSKIYPGIARNQPGAVVPYTRQVAVYVPANYKSGTPAPFIVVQDGMSATYRANLPPILDNLIHDKRIPPIVAVMVHNGGGDAQGSQRGLEYDTVSGLYTDFIETEVLPRIAKDYSITFTKDPEGRATMGGSSGAACAFTMAWFHPELYRRVLSYSGTYVNQQSPLNPDSPRGAWEYHATFIPNSPPKPIRIWMHVSERDNRFTDKEETWHNWVLANERMAAALKAKGYKYQYVYSQDSRHVDRAVVQQTLPEALEWLWKGYAK